MPRYFWNKKNIEHAKVIIEDQEKEIAFLLDEIKKVKKKNEELEKAVLKILEGINNHNWAIGNIIDCLKVIQEELMT